MNKFKYLNFYVGLILLLCSNYVFAQVSGGAKLDPGVKGQNVGMVVEQAAQSVFKWEQIADKSWKCTNTTAQKDQGTFTETGRDEWSVFLTSDKTSRKFQIDLFQKKVYDRSTGLETFGDITQVGLRPNGSSSPNPPTTGWTAFNPGTDYFFITNVGNNKVMDVAGSSTKVSTNVGIYNKHGGKNQKFKFVPKGNDYYAIETALKTNIFFSIHNSGKADNTNIKLNNPVGVQQHFKVEKNANGEIRMTSKLANDLYLGADDAGNNLVVRKGDKGKKILFKLTPATVETTNGNPGSAGAGKITMVNTTKTFVVTITKVDDSDFEKVLGPNNSAQVAADIGDVFTFSTSSDAFEALPYTVTKLGETHRIVVGERYTSGKGNKLPNVKANRYSYDLKKVDPIFIDYTKTQAIKNVKGKTVGYGGMRKELFEPLKNQDIDWNNQDGDFATKNHFSYDLLMEMNASTETKMFYSSSAYEESFSANVGADTPKGGGSASLSHTSSNSSEETNIYSYSRTKVRAYSVKLEKEHIALTNDFKNAVKALPKTYNSGAYRKFINQWGTHYPVSTTYGGVQVAAYKFNAKEVMESESMAIGVEGNVKAASAGGGYSTSSEHREKQENSSGMHRAKGGTGIGENFTVDMTNSVPVEINLKRLHELLAARYFKDGTSDNELSSRKANLKKAITEYIGSTTDNGRSLKPRMYKMSDIQWKVTKDDDLEVYGWVKYKAFKGNKAFIDEKPWSRSDAGGSRVNTKHGTVERISGHAIIAVTAENGAVNPANYKFGLYADLRDDVWDGDEKIGSGNETITLDKVNTTGYQRISFSLSDGDGKIEVSAKVEEVILPFDQ